MGFLKGNVTFRRYRVVEDPPVDFRNFFDERIKLHAFSETTAETREKIIGWTSVGNVLDTDFQYASYLYGEYVLFNLRVDRKIIPPALLRVKTLEAEERYLKEQGLKKIFRQQRAEIRDRVRKELLKKITPVPSFHEVCWSYAEGWLLFGTLSEKAAEDFEELFKQTFNLQLVPHVPWDPALLEPEIIESLSSAGNQSSLRSIDNGN